MSTSVMSSSWIRVGEVPPTALTDARLQLHHAAQIAVSAAISYIAARPDDSHTALTWNAGLRALTTEPIAALGSFGLRCGWRTSRSTRSMRMGWTTQSFALPGRTIAEGHAWLEEVAAQAGLDPARPDVTQALHHSRPSGCRPAPRFRSGHGNEFVELVALLVERGRADR